MSKKRSVSAICMWRDYPGEEESGLPWSVSLEDADGEEISCDGGAETSDEAWDRAVELADDHGVPAKMIRESGEVIMSYDPSGG